MAVNIHKIEVRDKRRWLTMWNGYCRFYERDLSGPVTRHTWAPIMDPASPVHAIVAERPGEGVIATTYGSADFREGVRAFLDKRPPRWTGK